MGRAADLPPRLLERRGGALLVVLALTVGAVVLPGLGWLIGVVLLWTSFGWRRADKLIGTLVGPASLALPFAVRLFVPSDITNLSSSSCSAGGFCAPQILSPWNADISTIGAFLVVVHLMLALYLLLRFRPGATIRALQTAAPGRSNQ